jgi:hypothetical protein
MDASKISTFANNSVFDLSRTEMHKGALLTKASHKALPTKPEAPVTKIT